MIFLESLTNSKFFYIPEIIYMHILFPFLLSASYYTEAVIVFFIVAAPRIITWLMPNRLDDNKVLTEVV